MTRQGATPTWRLVETARGDEIAVAISQHGILVREKGRHTTYGPIPPEAILSLGAKYHAGVVGKTKPRRRRITRGLLTTE